MKVRTIVFSLGVQLLLASVVSAQSTVANVAGTVQDQSSLPLPGVMVVLRSVDENTSQDVVSDNAGTFQFLNVKPDTYAPTASLPGFNEVTVHGVQLAARQTLRIPVTLPFRVTF